MKKLFKFQGFQLLVFILLLCLLWWYIDSSNLNNVPQFLGLRLYQWIWLSVALALIHQSWVLFFWRLELHYNKISEIFGPSGFKLYSAGFALFGLSRFLAIIPVAKLSANTIEIDRIWINFLILILSPIILWTFYSVKVFFTVKRALGADHFFEAYRQMPLETRGIFKYLPNAMYTGGLLILYIPGLWLLSEFGLLFAFLHHLMVWTHYFCTEKPDMKVIYG